MYCTHQGTEINKISTCPAYHGYGKNKKNAKQHSQFPLVLHAETLIKTLGHVEFSRPAHTFKNKTICTQLNEPPSTTCISFCFVSDWKACKAGRRPLPFDLITTGYLLSCCLQWPLERLSLTKWTYKHKTVVPAYTSLLLANNLICSPHWVDY